MAGDAEATDPAAGRVDRRRRRVWLALPATLLIASLAILLFSRTMSPEPARASDSLVLTSESIAIAPLAAVGSDAMWPHPDEPAKQAAPTPRDAGSTPGGQAADDAGPPPGRAAPAEPAAREAARHRAAFLAALARPAGIVAPISHGPTVDWLLRPRDRVEAVVAPEPSAPEPPVEVAVAPPQPVRPRRSVAGDYSEVVSVRTDRPVVALTFDCGAGEGHLAETLDALRAYDARATFFVTGDFARSYPDAITRIASDGHELANHTKTHRDLVELSDRTIRQELEQTEETLIELTGMSTKPLMRMPFGSRNTRVLRVVAEEGYRSIYWSLDSGDWRATATVPGVLGRVLRNTGAGDVVVHHCAPGATAWALPGIFEGLAEQGLSMVTVSNLLQDE